MKGSFGDKLYLGKRSVLFLSFFFSWCRVGVVSAGNSSLTNSITVLTARSCKEKRDGILHSPMGEQ